VAIIGVGNTLMADDGIGPAAVRRLLEGAGQVPGAGAPRACPAPQLIVEAEIEPGIVAVLGEVAGMALLRYFKECAGIVVIDGIDAGAEPGALFRFSPDDAGVTQLRSNSLHGLGVGHLVANARLFGADPEVVVVAVQVADVRPLPDTLSPPVAAVLARAAELALSEARGLMPPEEPEATFS
jgi:hydrogenase maturation protease